MASSDTGGRSLLRTGCIGCGAVAGLVFVIGAIIVGLAYMRAQSEEIRGRVLEPTLPAAVADAGETAGEQPAERPPARPEPGRLLLDVELAEFELKPAAPGERLRIDASYDENAFELREELRSTEGEIPGWVYEVSLRPTGSPMMTMIKQAFSRNDPKLEVYVPPDMPLALEAEIDRGGGILDLGGLWITSADFRIDMGGMVLQIDEPLVEPMDSFTLQARMGGFVAQRLGNASPRRLDVEVRMSGGDVDLRGPWSGDAEIGLTWKRGGLAVELPDRAGVRGLDPTEHGSFLREAREDEPTLTFTLDGKLDDIEFSR